MSNGCQSGIPAGLKLCALKFSYRVLLGGATCKK